jgi:hypothetical protein
MKISSANRALPAIAALCVAAGCSGANSANMVTPPASRPAAHAPSDTSKSWMKPGSPSQKLLYVTNYQNTVSVYAYPSLSYVGELTGFAFPLFDCADKKGDVWIVDYGTGTLSEYAHGGTTPIKQITGLSNPYACAIDKNGDLAVAVNIESSSERLVEVALFTQASGPPYYLSDSNFALIDGLAYDNNDNLFLDGYAPDEQFHYAELPANDPAFTEITLSQTPSSPGAVVWDGHYIDIGDYGSTIYQTQGATVLKTISLNLAYPALRGFFFLSPKKLIAANSYGQNVDIFRYPAGGKVKKSITYGLATPWDVVLSK